MLATLPRLARRLLAGLGLAAVLTAAAAPAAAEPALWAIRDADSTIYIFGTVHVLKPETRWRSDKVTRAFQQSGELVLEVTGADDPAALQPLVMKYGVDPANPLSSKLDPKDQARLKTAAAAAGLPPQGLEPLRPWMAALTLAIVPIVKAGFDPKSGVETILTAEAKAAGKPVGALETLEQQVRFFADMPQPMEVALLSSTLDDVDEGAERLDAMVTAWAAGDVEALEAEFVTETKRDYPQLYDIVLVKRNRVWADQLKTMLDGQGTSFVAVGAGHLVGPDSVQVELARRGVKVERR